MKTIKRTRILAIVSAVVLVLGIAGNIAGRMFESSINGYLGLQTYKLVSSGDGTENTTYFPSAWDDEAAFNRYQRQVCERVEAEGAVLLTNQGSALPLQSGARVSLFSHSSVDIIYGGTGSGSVDTSTAPKLKDAMEAAGFTVNPVLWDFYTTGAGAKYKRSVTDIDGSATTGSYKINEVPWSRYTDEVKASFADYSDAAIFVLSRCGGEGGDLWRTGTDGENGDYLSLSQEEKETLGSLGAMKMFGMFGKVIVLINSSNPVNMDFLRNPEYDIDACLWIGGVGQYGLNSVAQILAGTVNPSGRLVDTFCYDNLTAPSMQNFGNMVFINAEEMGLTDANPVKEVNQNYVVYQEGIYVGYRYYETRYEDTVLGQGNTAGYDYHSEVAFPFGYGLSYTSFVQSDMTVTEQEDRYDIAVTVTNTGNTPGRDVVEVYLQKPYTDYDRQMGIEKAAVELVGFAKTDVLERYGAETVTISVPKQLLRTYDAAGAGTYIVEPGDYYFAIGNAHEAVDNILAVKGADVQGDAAKAVLVALSQDKAESIPVSKAATGADIVNHFDDVDLNRYAAYDGKVVYLSRSDWQGTYPAPVVLMLTAAMADDIRDVFVTREGYTMPAYGEQNGLLMANMIGKAYDDPDWEKLLNQMSFDDQVMLITNSFHNTKMIESINKPGTKETNGPQGITDSFINGSSGGMAMPAEVVMASTWSREVMAEVGACIGEQGLKSNTQGLYGPAANIHRNAYCGRNYEYFSEDGFLSGAMAVPEVAAIEAKGIYVMMKHFALNDQETNRAGVTTWANEQSIREIYLLPFELATVEANVHGMMTVMNRIGAKWGGAHSGLLTDVLRGEWGFEGAVITDCTVNSRYTDSLVGLQGGSDFWDGVKSVEQTDEHLQEHKNDPYVCQLMRQAVHRLLYVQANSSAMNGLSSLERVVRVVTWWEKLLYVLTGLGFLGTVAGVTLLIRQKRKAKRA